MYNFQKDFPVFTTHPDIVYLDSASTSQKPTHVIEGVAEYLRSGYANIHRGAYELSEISEKLYTDSKKSIARHIWAESHHEIVYTANATGSFNLLAATLEISGQLKRGDRVLLSLLEHHANIVPWQMLQDRIGIEIVFVELTTEFQIDEVDLLAKLTPNTRVVSFSGASNVTGSVFNWHRISELVRSIRGDQTYLVMDGSQAVPHVSLDVRSLDLDFCIFTGHKLYADSGIGILYGKKSHLKSLTPSIGGGGAINFVHEDGYEIAGLPFRFEPGTPNMTGAVSLLRSLEYIESIGGMVSIQEHESLLVEYFLTQWKSLSKSFRLIGSMDRKDRIGVFSFTHDTLHANDLADLLAEKNICVRAGHHCTEPFHRRLGLSGSIRVSIGISTTLGDLDRLFSVLKQI